VGVTHTWVTRAYCPGCGDHLWTTPGSGRIFCTCGGAEIRDDVVITGEEVSDDALFLQVVRDDLHDDDVIVEHG